MNSFLKILITAPALLINASSYGQIKNSKSMTAKIDGNCEMCRKTIEAAATVKHTASLNWNIDTKVATVSYDPDKTNPDDILKRVAYAGYDNEKYLAPDEAYEQLPSCCQYERRRKKAFLQLAKENTKRVVTEQYSTTQATVINPFETIYSIYFDLKNALIKADAAIAEASAAALAKELSELDTNKLEHDQHTVWLHVYKSLISDSKKISGSKSIEEQRNQFMGLSEKMHELVKVAKLRTPVYYQHCPMYDDGNGANWLSLENAVKNPYYGSQMLSCGKTVETIK